jgi:ATP-dependent RNA helicase DHX29
VPLSGVSVEADDRKFSCYMTEISSPNPTQSEAYISTVALFVIFGGSPKEAKSHLRLPATWKDLWDELAKERKEHLAKDDREELRQIRQLVEKAETESERVDTPLVYNTQQELTDKSRTTPKPGAYDNVQNLNPQSLIDLWSSKATSHAYIAMSKSRRTLPIFEFKTELLTAIESHQVVIICGETGCGKSTQVPAYILENELSNGRQCKIYCTEPRRISAISLARRVSEELGERKSDVGTLNSLVGYAIRLESHITPQTKLVYATTGIVMRMLEGGNDLQEITHLVLDEVHERTIDSDFLLIVLRKLMLRRPELRVILMSATVNAEQFSNYLNGAPVLNVPGRTFPVQTKYLEDAIEITGYGKNSGSNMNSNENEDEDDLEKTQDSSKGDLTGYSPQTVSTLAEFDEYRIDYELVLRLLERIAKNALYAAYSKAILVFLPGLAEIRRMNDMLAGHPVFVHDWYIYPLHSTIATEEQEKAFLIPPPGIRKIVLATNIAETGITIPDVTCVIDTGKHREMRFDERRQLSRLIECFISRANAKQRRGRAGRVQNGLCFHLFTKARHDTSMAEQQTPEMLRLSLQDLVLRVKICKLGGIEQTLSEALDPPLAKNIRRAIDSLIDVKALTAGEDMTALGRQLAKLPLDVFLGKLILLGSLFSCLDATLTIAAILSSKTPFSAPMGARAQADLARIAYKKGDSDLLTVYNAYCAWKRVCQTRSSFEYQFCRKNFLSPQILSSIEDLKVQLTTTLVDSGFLSLDDNEKLALNRARFYSRQRNFVDLPSTYNTNTTNDLVVNSVIAWSFYPKLLVRDNKGWRNVANNQTVSLFPTSVNKGVRDPPTWLSFYHIMQGSNKFYNAHETSAAEDFAIALVCGEADFRMYAGVVVIDGNRIRFKVNDWKIMIVLKRLRERIRGIISHFYRNPGKALSKEQRIWFEIWQKIFSREELLKTLYVHKG